MAKDGQPIQKGKTADSIGKMSWLKREIAYSRTIVCLEAFYHLAKGERPFAFSQITFKCIIVEWEYYAEFHHKDTKKILFFQIIRKEFFLAELTEKGRHGAGRSKQWRGKGKTTTWNAQNNGVVSRTR